MHIFRIANAYFSREDIFSKRLSLNNPELCKYTILAVDRGVKADLHGQISTPYKYTKYLKIDPGLYLLTALE